MYALFTTGHFRFNQYSRLLMPIVGGVVILLALASFLTDQRVSALLFWLHQVFGWGYAVIYGVLLGAGLCAWRRLLFTKETAFWMELGQQAAGGIATLSLTFTLLGISLGIGALTDKTIEPQTIQSIIQELTGHFSTAFMTTVVGLPTACALRAALALRYVRLQHDD